MDQSPHCSGDSTPCVIGVAIDRDRSTNPVELWREFSAVWIILKGFESWKHVIFPVPALQVELLLRVVNAMRVSGRHPIQVSSPPSIL